MKEIILPPPLKTAVLFTMLGLGDNISCNGMARYLLREHKLDKIIVIAWAHYAEQVRYMYRDDPRIEVHSVNSGNEYNDAIGIIRHALPSYLYLIGHTIYPGKDFKEAILPETEYYQYSYTDMIDRYPTFDCHQMYYDCINIPFQNRFDDFYLERDIQEEQRVFSKLNPTCEDYIFIQDDSSRGYNINIDTDLKIIRNDTTESIFHYYSIIQYAKEVHVMESSFRCLIETIPTDHVKFYLHEFRNTHNLTFGNQINKGATRKDWIVIK